MWPIINLHYLVASIMCFPSCVPYSCGVWMAPYEPSLFIGGLSYKWIRLEVDQYDLCIARLPKLSSLLILNLSRVDLEPSDGFRLLLVNASQLHSLELRYTRLGTWAVLCQLRHYIQVTSDYHALRHLVNAMVSMINSLYPSLYLHFLENGYLELAQTIAREILYSL